MQRTKKILSILCALCLLVTGYSNLLSYAILAGTHTYTLTASDGNTYRITVTYDEASGIPDDAVLQVREITEDKTEKKEEVRDGIVVSGGSETERELSEYEKYVSKSARALGMSEYDLTFFKIFDITLTNAETGEEYQPNKNVKVSIQLLNGSFNGYSNIDVVHIHDETNTAEVMECAVNEDTLEFETDSFSVYSISTNEVHIIEFRFYITDEDVAETVTDDGFGVVGGASKYRQISVNTENGEEYFQRIKSGETPVVPQLTDKFGKQFAGWFEGTFKDNDNTLYFGKTAYDFNHIFENTKFNPDENLIVVNLYARYSTFVNIIFHDQYDEATNTDPVMLIRRGELINGSADIKISDVTSIYKGGNNYAFYGWSTVHVKDPTDPDSVPGDEYMKDPDENGCLSITADLHLYPVFKPVHWLSYYSAETGSGATYIPAAAYFEDEGPTKLQVPVWEGHEFKGWYNGILSTNENAGDTVAYSTQITDENGHFLEENMTGNGVVVNNGKLYLTQDTMLFAQWGLETVSYKVIIWKEKTTDTPKTSPKMYDFSDSIKLKTAPNTSESESIVSVADEYKTLEYLTNYGYVFASCSPDVKVDNNGYTVLDVYYDLDPNYTRTPSANPHTLKFVDSMANNNTEYVFAAYNESVAYQTSLLTGNNGGSYVPANPSSPTVGYEGQKVFTFTGWYADQMCSTQVFFSREDYDSYTGYNKKVLYDTMPDNNLTIYAGWSADWFLVRIDPNYGAFDGVGSTWFWETYDGDLVEEYKNAKRDYVYSSSGEYYYVKHDRAYYGYTGVEWDNSEKDRDVYYTDNISLATEDTTFENVPGLYTYAGWYEVLADGTEVLYDFSRHVDHHLILKLHWKKNGIYYIEYNFGTNGVIPDDTVYADQAGIPIVNSVNAPSGYEFVGWRIRGDASGRVYRVGDTLTLDADYAVTVKGKDKVFLDAVYVQVGTAKIIYDANGGTIAGSLDQVDLGSPVSDITFATHLEPRKTINSTTAATISNLVNNSKVWLSDGTGFTRENMVLVGWSHSKNFKEGNTIFRLGGDYGVDSNDPVTLYAVWEVAVMYHINSDDATAAWNGDWTGYTATAENGKTAYSTSVYYNNPVSAPAGAPVVDDGNGTMFYYWTESPDVNTPYDFSQPVSGPLHLYAKWGQPQYVTSFAVDASGSTLHVVDWVKKEINVGADPVTLDATFVTVPDDYTFAFAAACADTDLISENNSITELYYNYNINEPAVYVRYANGTAAPLGSNYVYFVYYQNKTLDIRYMSMDSAGVLSDVTITNTSAAHSLTLTGSHDVSDTVTAPLAWADNASLNYYSFAIGASTPSNVTGIFNASDLRVITGAVDSDGSRPSLQVRNTWRGLQVSTDGTEWVDCGYDTALYVVYYEQQPTVILVEAQTIGTESVMGGKFKYTFTVYASADQMQGEPLFAGDYYLSSGEEQSAILFYNGAAAQVITVQQEAKDGFTTVVNNNGEGTVEGLKWTYATNGSSEPVKVIFKNTQSDMSVDVHVARIEFNNNVNENNVIVTADDMRAADHSVNIVPGETKEFLDVLAAADLFTGDPDSYTFGAVVLGRVNGNVVVPVSMDVMSVSFDKVSGNVYEIVLKDGSSKKISELSDYQIFYLYYQMPEIRYVKAGIERDQNGYRYISDVTGQMTDGTNVTDPTYNKNYFTINGFDVKQNQKLAFKVNGIKLTQDVGSNTFRMPAILDDGQYVRYLSYEEIGIGEAGATSTANILNSSGLTMYLRVNNTEIEWSFDGTSWTAFNGLPTIYAVYEERGYDLQITKSVPIDVGEDPVFGIVIESNAITKTSYEIEGYPDSTIQAYPKTETSMGKIKLEVSDGSKIKIKGLGQGTYTITEDGNYNYILTAKSGAINGTGADHQVKNNSTLTIDLDGEKKVELTNTSKEICKITVGSGELTFHKLQDAVDYIKKNLTTKETISMLTDYVMPSSDKPVIPAGYNITLNTASRTGGTHHYTGSQDYATITRSDNSTEGTMITNLGTLTIDNIMIDGNNVEADSAMITSSGTIILTGGTNLTRANNPNGNGGAIYASAGTVEFSENSNLVNNNAANGGAVYSLGSSIIISGKLRNNHADKGGAVYYNGTGTISMTDTAEIKENNAREKGGAIYTVAGIVAVTTGTISHNSAAVSGGAIYTENGAVNVSGGMIGGTDAEHKTANTAVNGAAIFVETGTATFSGGKVTSNVATNGGAVGVGSGNAKLYFQSNPYIYNNYMGSAQSNVYLDRDTDAVINAAGIGNGSETMIGIYVPGDMDNSDLFQNRGVPGAKFGVFSDSANITKFKNDRLPEITVTKDDNTRRIIWGRPINVQLCRLNYYDNGFPRKGSNGIWTRDGNKIELTNYYLPSNHNAASTIADAIRNDSTINKKDISLSNTAAFAYAFVDDGTNKAVDFENYITEVNWSNTLNSWTFTKRDGTVITGAKLVIYYSEPAYINIENNTPYALTISDILLRNYHAVNTKTQVGYGYVFAYNGAVQDELKPITAENLTLAAGKSVKLMFPGGLKNQKYTISGEFAVNDNESINVVQTGVATTQLTGDNRLSFTLSNGKTGGSTNSSSVDVIFGGEKSICKIVVDTAIDTIAEGETVGNDEEYGKTAYLFSSIKQAVAFAAKYKNDATIEMLVDYLIPGTDIITLPAGLDITLTTAIGSDNTNYYYSSNPNARATISRDNSHSDSFIKATDGQNITSLTVKNIVFDGKNYSGTINGGIIKTNNCIVIIDNCDFINCVAKNGGGIYIEFDGEKTIFDPDDDTDLRGTLTVTGCNFIKCQSSSTTNREGGGAIWTNARKLTLIGSKDSEGNYTTGKFDSCTAYDQGGAVFHRIDWAYDDTYRQNSISYVQDCWFFHCTARAAGGLEIDAHFVSVIGSWFENCQSTARNAGGLNIYLQKRNSSNADVDCEEPSSLTATGCTFINCTAKTNGGGLRTTTLEAEITDCLFKNNIASENGGGISSTNTLATGVLVEDTVIDGCSAKNGGGVYFGSKAKGAKLIISGTATKENSGEYTYSTVIQNNIASNAGGGVYTLVGSQLINAKIANNHLTTATATNAAGMYSSATVTFGKTEAENDATYVYDNTIQGGIQSNLRILGGNKAESVVVNCDFANGSRVGIINHGKLAEQFGKSPNSTNDPKWRPAGLSDPTEDRYPTIVADDGTLYGVIDRTDENGVKVIWGGPPVCKITDEAGNLLYLDDKGNPAIFDSLDGGSDGSWKSANALLKAKNGPVLYSKTENGYELYTAKTYYIKMLVETYETKSMITTVSGTDKTIILTTARSDDSIYPYRGTAGTTCTIIRSGFTNGVLFNVKCNMTFKDITIDGGANNGLTCTVNGALINIVEVKGIKCELGENAILQNSHTTKSGGAVNIEGIKDVNKSSDFTLNGGTIINCQADVNGGAIYINAQTKTNPDRGYVKLISGNITGCSANNGGAVYVTNGTLIVTAARIQSCTATNNGGAICYNNGQNGIINGGTISGCRAKNGGGVYVEGGKSFTISGGFIMDNSASEKGGGVATGSGAQLIFSAAPRITGNTCAAANDAPGKVCNVQLDFDSTTIINTDGISNGARIGVYVPGDDTSGNETLYDKHGGEGDPFGQYIDSKDTSCLYVFTNDRNGLKGGRIAGLADTDHRIFWVESFTLEITNTVVSSVNTDKNEPFAFRVKLSGVARDGTAADTINSPADDKAKYGELYFVNGVAVKRVVKNGNNLVLEDLVLKDGETVIAQKLPDGLNYEIEELLTPGQKAVFIPEKGYTQNEQSVAIKGYIGENANNTSVEDSYKSYVEFKNLRPVSKITTRNNTQLYFLEMYDYEWFDNGKIPYSEARYMPTAYMTLEEAFTHANGKTLYTSSYNSASHRYEYEEYSTKTYHIEMLTDVTAKSMSSVKNNRTITLTTASKSAEMYPYYGYGSTATIGRGFGMNSMFKVENGSFILNNIDIDGKMPQANTEVGYTGGDGGIVYVTGSGELTVQSGASLMNSLSEGRGGAIYVADGGKLTVSGGTINLNVVDGTKGGEGAGIYLAQGSVMHISGKPYFGGKGVDAGGGINYSTGNICINADGQDRQDIFIAGYEGPENSLNAVSLVIDGDITSDLYDDASGTIWVWAEKSPHYKTLQQFAVIKSGVTLVEETCNAFRNSRSDADTDNNTGEYLYGTLEGETDGYVYWNGLRGKRKIILRKVSDEYDSLLGAKFDIIKQNGNVFEENLVSGVNGVFYIGVIPYGTYLIHEKEYPTNVTVQQNNDGWWYVLTVEKNDDNGNYGVTCSGKFSTKDLAEASVKPADNG